MTKKLSVAATALCVVALMGQAVLAGPPADCCDAELVFSFSDERISDVHIGPGPTTAVDAPTGPNCLGVTEIVNTVPAGAPQSARIFLNISSNLPGTFFQDPDDEAKRGKGIQGFSLGVAIDNLDFDGGGFDTVNTAMELNPLWGGTGFGGGSGPGPTKPFPSLFISAGVVDPSANTTPGGDSGQEGIILAFVNCLDGCSLADFGEFPVLGTESMVVISVVTEVDVPDSEEGVTGGLRIQDGLKKDANSVPAESVLTVAGDSFSACNRDTLNLSLTFRPAVVIPFIRCDANGDAKVDLADPIYSINALFRGGRAADCAEALDCNNDDSQDLGDIMFGIDYLFRGGAVPAGPFPDCGAGAEGDECLNRTCN